MVCALQLLQKIMLHRERRKGLAQMRRLLSEDVAHGGSYLCIVHVRRSWVFNSVSAGGGFSDSERERITLKNSPC